MLFLYSNPHTTNLFNVYNNDVAKGALMEQQKHV